MWSENEEAIGSTGSENGIIILDLEHSEGARISLEEKSTVAPFSITIGIYGLLMHTIFCSDKIEADEKISLIKQLIEKAIKYCQKDAKTELYSLLDQIALL